MGMISTLRNPAQWLLDYFGSGGSVNVNAKTTLENASFWYGINKISGNVGTLKLNVMKRLDPTGAEKAKDHFAYRLLALRPNAYQTPMVFKQTLTANAILWGNGRAYIHRAGNQSELIPLRPDATITFLYEGEKWHVTKPDLNERVVDVANLVQIMRDNPESTVPLMDKDVLHIQGFGDGICGQSLFQVARQSIEISLGGDKRAATQVNKGFTGQLMLQAPRGVFKDAQDAKEFLETFEKLHGADGEARAIGLLREGITAEVLQMSNKDAEFLESRKFQRQEAALWLLLEQIIGDDSSVSYNSLEQKQLSYLVNCLMNWLMRWEQECDYKLLSPQEFYSDTHFCKFNTAGLLRTDFPSTVEALVKLRAAGFINANEGRDKIDMNPIDGGEEYFNPNITPSPATQENEGNEPSAAMVDRLEHLMGVEENRVNNLFDRNAETDRFEAFYEGWRNTLGIAIENLGGDRWIAEEHCDQSLKHIMQTKNPINLRGSAELLAKEIQNVQFATSATVGG